MQLHMGAIKGFLGKVIQTANPLTLKSITKKNLPYFIGWVASFIWLYSYFLPMGGFRFVNRIYNGNISNSMVYSYIWLISGGLIPVLFHGISCLAT